MAGRSRYFPGFYVRLRRHGKDIRRYGGPDRQTALGVLERLKREMDREELLGEAQESETTFGAFVPRYLEHAKREQTALSFHTLSALIPNRLVPFFGRLRLKRIRPSDIERYLATRAGVKGPTRNRELSALSSMFRHAQDLGLVRRNPTKDVRRAAEPQAPLPLVPLQDQHRLVAAAAKPYRLLLMLGLETGMRLGEMLRLEWRDVDLAAGTLLVRETKNKRPRVLALTQRLHGVLEQCARDRVRPLHGPDLVLEGARLADGSLAKAWRRAFKDAAASIGRPELRIHDLRHLTAINLVRAGMDLPTVQAFLGHRSLVSTLRYAAYADDAAAKRAARALDGMRAPMAGGSDLREATAW